MVVRRHKCLFRYRILVDVLPDDFNRHRAHMGVFIFMQQPQGCGQNISFNGAATTFLTAVTGQCVQRHLSHIGCGIFQHVE